MYYNAYMSYFSLEEKFPAAGLEVQIARNYYRLTPDTSESAVAGQRGQPVAQQRLKYHRERIEEGTQLNSGDLIEVELNVTSKNDYEYLIVRDPRAAGCETVEVRSGYQGNGLGAYAEFHDDHAAFFIQNMARGTHTLTYQVRAEVPGRFTALPASVAGMYAPELKGNSTDQWLVIEDSPTTSP